MAGTILETLSFLMGLKALLTAQQPSRCPSEGRRSRSGTRADDNPGVHRSFRLAPRSPVPVPLQHQQKLFNTLFKTEDKRADKLENPVPRIDGIDPETIPAGGTGLVLTVVGANFMAESVVRASGANRPTRFVDATQLTVTLPATDLAATSEVTLTVPNLPPGGGISNPAILRIK